MPAPFAARSIIITVSVLAAAALAAYENELIRAWIDGARHRIALGLHTLGDEIQPKRRPPRKEDASMSEEKGDAAEERRRQARADILERGRILEEKRRRAKDKAKAKTKAQDQASPSFDSLVDNDGRLRSEPESVAGDGVAAAPASATATATATGAEPVPLDTDTLRSRQQSFETAYEREMRTSWKLPLPPRRSFDHDDSSHASESLLDLTPTTEDFADPDYSVPSSSYFHTPSAPVEPADFYYAHPSRPHEPIEPRQPSVAAPASSTLSSAPSIAGSSDLVHPSEADLSEDDLISEPDGIRTPASAWTDVESTVSAEH